MPQPSDAMIRELGERYRYLVRRRNICLRKINKLEPVASAMRRGNSDAKHPALADIFEEQVRNAKSELLVIDDRSLYYPELYTGITRYSEIMMLSQLSY